MSVILRAAVLALSVLGWAAPVLAEPPPAKAFFSRPALRAPKLSPSGRYLAVQSSGKEDRMFLAVIDLQTMETAKVVAAFRDADVYQHDWVSEDRLVLQASESPDGSRRVDNPGLWAVNRDGSEFRQLIQANQYTFTTGTLINDRRLDANYRFFKTLRDGSSDVLVLRLPWSHEADRVGLQLSRLDTKTGQVKNLSQGAPEHVGEWLVDWRGEPRAVEATVQGRARIYRREADGQWKLWIDDDAHRRQQFEPYWFGPDGVVLVTAGYGGTSALFKLDPQTNKPEPQPLVRLDGYDYHGRLIFDPVARKLLGVRYETDAFGTAWVDASMKAIQADIDAKLPGFVNLIDCDRCLDAPFLVVSAMSDRLPTSYWIYKPATQTLQPLGRAQPGLKIADMGERDVVRFKARDGLTLPLLVTQPPGPAARRPAVVLVHGGPYVRGTHWAWEPDAQFLASRGYVVLEPEFRGSSGYGWELFHAGWKQWGLAMQTDLADTVAFADKQGWIDRSRVCVMGASYGGYAALMGAVTQGDVFKCAVSWVGVTDIGLMDSIHWSDFSEEWKQYGMKRLVADVATDAEQIRQTSPLQRAKEIKMPLLVAYGGLDRRVPIKHGTEFRAALRPDQPIEWVVYPDEGHGWFNLKTNEDFWGRVERFLGKHLAAPN
ncbi:alpha/beta fold hydrolase [Pelomonas sp. Root1444]|uniref:S9 family peptidase n=1 Tax=Pelomonas sp. Root1444 TaxID=1736464 RepID=UPI0007034F2B|nr:alpha/beta fold hydrolase [Pelomonas sp. Root1444]KQY85409.1 hypothetical protein ASD35_22600 [Pelomonas sp. Root1444]